MLKRFLSRLLCLFLLASGAAYAKPITFDLLDTQGQVTHESFPGKYILLAIGYTSCPDICPTTLYEYGLTMKAIKNPEKIVPIFVTIDPVNDDAETLKVYTAYFDERIVGLTGTMANIQALANQLGATFGYRLDGKKVDMPEKGTSYTVYHSSLIYLIDPNGELVDVYDYQIGDKGLTEALDKVLSPEQTSAETPAPSTDNTANEGAAPMANSAATTCSLPNGFVENKQAIQLKDVYPQAKESRVALLNLWALWCAPCRVELPILDKLAREQSKLPLYALNLGDKEENIKKLFAEKQITALGTESTKDLALLRQLGGKGLPFNALFVNGTQVAIKNGIIEETDSLSAFAECIHQQP